MPDAPVIGFAGLTHLGIVSAAAAAATGFEVIAGDPDLDLVERLRGGDLVVTEPALDDLTARHPVRWSAEAADLGRCDVVFVSVDVPTDEGHVSDLGPVDRMISWATAAMAPGATLVILSQVPPGYTRGVAWPGAQRCYLVETLVFGRAVERALRPERFILGLDDPAAGCPAPLEAYLTAFGCPILPMRYESAELAKVAINVMLVASLTAANLLAEVCAASGGDWAEVEPALRLDARIGPQAYVRPGLGIGGANLDRDLVTVGRLAAEHGVEAGVLAAWQGDSEHRKDWALRVLQRELLSTAPDVKVTVLGLTYKEGTSSTRNSPGMRLSEAIGATTHDPVVANEVGPLEACRGADAVAVMTPWAEYRELDLVELAGVMAGRLVVDPFGVLDHEGCRQAGLQHHVIGRPIERRVR